MHGQTRDPWWVSARSHRREVDQERQKGERAVMQSRASMQPQVSPSVSSLPSPDPCSAPPGGPQAQCCVQARR